MLGCASLLACYEQMAEQKTTLGIRRDEEAGGETKCLREREVAGRRWKRISSGLPRCILINL